MRVLFQIRRSYRELAGGDVAVMLRTAQHLRELDVEVDDSCDVDQNMDAYDLVHVIDSSPGEETFVLGMKAIERHKPLVLTPLYWDTTEYEARGRWQPAALEDPADPNLAHRLRAARDQVTVAKRRFLVETADLVLPSSETERRRLQIDLGVQHERFQVVPFAAEGIHGDGSAEEFVRRYRLRDFVLCVARVEDNKNQLALVEACRRLGQPLVLIGPPNPLQPGYVDACRRAAGTAPLLVLGFVERRLLDAAYAAAKVHALPSWWEIPGLASLDAAAAGCNVVVSDRGSAREYLKDGAWYCDPGDVDSIASAIAAAHAAPRSAALRDDLHSRYSWDRTARATLSAYQQALAGHGNNGPEQRTTGMAGSRRVELLEDLARAQEAHLWVKGLVTEDMARQLAEHKAVLADRERQLAEHRAVLADREGLAERESVLADRVRRFVEHAAGVAEHERRIAAQQRAALADR